MNLQSVVTDHARAPTPFCLLMSGVYSVDRWMDGWMSDVLVANWFLRPTSSHHRSTSASLVAGVGSELTDKSQPKIYCMCYLKKIR